MSCGVGHRCGSDPTLLWLWRRLAATAPIPPLAWEPPMPWEQPKKWQKRQKKKKEADHLNRWITRQELEGVPIVAHWERIRLATMRLLVPPWPSLVG